MLLDWITVISLIGIGLLLVVVELIFVPGTTVVGILGFILTAIGIWIGYAALGTNTGHVILATTVLVAGIAFFYSFRSDSWTRFALKEQNRSRVNEDEQHTLTVGQEGTTVSALRPQGTALFTERHYQVQTRSEFLAPNTPIRIVKLDQNKIIVEAIS
ncbi:NfeD family protein [Pontibacter chinhatensis]|uniref:NfeD-like C-terminal, partner-binding n=1 Tax=Pontibacter chinhatensis TaxID=1436961 RepID=A0A1I2TF28_9BACT|nr:NfeD family protein [Pontibacter chinhatensis]SFG63534.1 NfeD-like C-terminal, partner-binding [Pontibacter chinhatensis]